MDYRDQEPDLLISLRYKTIPFCNLMMLDASGAVSSSSTAGVSPGAYPGEPGSCVAGFRSYLPHAVSLLFHPRSITPKRQQDLPVNLAYIHNNIDIIATNLVALHINGTRIRCDINFAQDIKQKRLLNAAIETQHIQQVL